MEHSAVTAAGLLSGPLTLFEHVDNGYVRDGDLVLMSAFGAGVTWASVLLRWGSA